MSSNIAFESISLPCKLEPTLSPGFSLPITHSVFSPRFVDSNKI